MADYDSFSWLWHGTTSIGAACCVTLRGASWSCYSVSAKMDAESDDAVAALCGYFTDDDNCYLAEVDWKRGQVTLAKRVAGIEWDLDGPVDAPELDPLAPSTVTLEIFPEVGVGSRLRLLVDRVLRATATDASLSGGRAAAVVRSGSARFGTVEVDPLPTPRLRVGPNP